MMTDGESHAEHPHMEAHVQITSSRKYDHRESAASFRKKQ